jgi:hypothetical protein
MVTLRAGYAFRSAIPEAPDGEVLAVQLRDIERDRVDWSRVVRTHLARAPGEAEWLQRGDILFVFRGTRYFALALDRVPAPAVAAAQFRLLRVLEPGVLLPEFLAWQLNQRFAQEYFQKAAQGTAQLTLQRGAIEAVKVAVPSLHRQRLVMDLVDGIRQERESLEEHIRIREEQLITVAMELFGTNGPEVDPPEIDP